MANDSESVHMIAKRITEDLTTFLPLCANAAGWLVGWMVVVVCCCAVVVSVVFCVWLLLLMLLMLLLFLF